MAVSLLSAVGGESCKYIDKNRKTGEKRREISYEK